MPPQSSAFSTSVDLIDVESPEARIELTRRTLRCRIADFALSATNTHLAADPSAVVSLTTSEFHVAVHALDPKVAVFDCDGTLWSGDAGSTFMHWTIETGLLSREATDWLDARYRRYQRGRGL